MIEAVCHCGAARLSAPQAPSVVTECNCSICRRTGARWAYYSPREVILPDGARTEAYVWGDRMLAFHRCRTCGCLTHWQSLDGARDRMAINARMMDLDWDKVRIRPFDGANTWAYLDEPA
ncbi:MAG: GFA family protein [Caulobacterales bacterium]|nr:GFA family protein [Caulobacterales bacterium]